MKRLLTLIVACCLMVGLLAGCGTGNTPTPAPAPAPSTAPETPAPEQEDAAKEFDPREITEGVTLTIAIADIPTITDINTNLTTLAIEEKFGVDLQFISIPKADYDTKLNAMVMGGDKLPDIILNQGTSNNDWSGWVAQEVLLPLTDYFKDPNLSKNVNESIDLTGINIIAQLTQADGEIYWMPKFGASPNGEVYGRLWYYEPWLEQIGMDVPTTTEEFYEVCKAIANTDLNGNGKKDEIALGGDLLGGGETDCWFTCLMSAFVYAHDKEYRIVNDGKVNYAYNTEAWKEGLKYIKRFIDEGLIPVESLTQSQADWQAQTSADFQTVWCYFGWEPYNATSKAMSWCVANDCLMPLEGPDGTKNAMYRPNSAAPGGCITVDCENPEAAFLILDYLCSEEMSIVNRWGTRGLDWDYWEDAKVDNKADYSAYNPAGDIMLIAYDDNTFWSSGTPQNGSWMGLGPSCYSARVFNGRAVKSGNLTEDEALELQWNNEVVAAYTELHKYSPAQVVDAAPLTAEENQQLADIKTSLINYVNEMSAKFLTGAVDIDAGWDDYLNELKVIGIDTAIAIYQSGYDRAH